MKKPIILVAVFLVLVALGSLIWWITKPANLHHKHADSLTANVITVQTQAMPVIIPTQGTLEAKQSVSILPQLSGTIKSIEFQEGQMVKKGQLLMVIDPASMLINVQQAKAILRRDQAQLMDIQDDATRMTKLIAKGYVTRQQYEQTVAKGQAQKALVDSDEEQVQQAENTLSHTQITAPIDGKTGSLNVKVGDVVNPNSTQALFTINQLTTMLINFSIPQEQLDLVRHYQENAHPLNVQVFPPENQPPLVGHLTFIDNNINADTGTVNLSAEVDNSHKTLWPGETLPIRLILTIQPNALVIPASAVQIDQQGNFVFLYQNKRAKIQRITVDRQVDDLAVIGQGLHANEEILTDIPPDLEDGSPVKINHGVSP